MKSTKALLFLATGSLGLVTAGTLRAQEPGDQPPSGGEHPPSAAAPAPGAAMSQLITASAKVEKVDLDKRELTLKTDKGKEFTINVPENVTRLENVKPGDKVRASFYESLAVSLQKPGEPTTPEQKRTFGERAPGELPGGMAGAQVTTTATIKKIDHVAEELTIETPSGQTNTVKVTNPQVRAELKKMKVGDRVQATYTQAMATSVTSGRRM